MRGKQSFDSLDVLYIELTNACNFKCIHCGNGTGEKNTLEVDLLKKVFTDFKEGGGEKIMLTGGEPLLHPDLKEILDVCKEHKFTTHLSTNSFLLNNSHFDFIFDYDLMFRCSLDGSKEQHNAIRGHPFAYEGLISAIKKMGKHDRQVILRTTVMKQNKDSIVEMIYELERLTKEENIKINGVKIWPVRNIGRADSAYMLTPQEYFEFLRNLNQKTRNFKPKFKIVVGPTFGIEQEFKGGPIQSNEIYTCNILSKALEISFTGEVYPCSFIHYSLGNVRAQSIQDIFRSQNAVDFRKTFLDKSRKDCDGCSSYESCKGGCIAEQYQKLLTGKDEKVKDVYCFRDSKKSADLPCGAACSGDMCD